MKVLVKIKRSPVTRVLVALQTDELSKEVAVLVGSGEKSKALATILAKGMPDRCVSEEELPKTKAAMFLTERNVYWDLTYR